MEKSRNIPCVVPRSFAGFVLNIRELSFNPFDEQCGGVLLEMVLFEARYDHFFSGLRGGHAAILTYS